MLTEIKRVKEIAHVLISNKNEDFFKEKDKWFILKEKIAIGEEKFKISCWVRYDTKNSKVSIPVMSANRII